MSAAVIDNALHSTYHLAGADAQRLRRLTRESGLDAENVLSRLAIVRSLSSPDGPHRQYQPSTAGRSGKEIKGSVLLGRPRQAALIIGLLLHNASADFADLRAALTWHWARGLKLLDDEATNGDVLHTVAVQLTQNAAPQATPQRRAVRAGLGASLRDELAAAVGRRFTRWPTEVCRLVAMAARLDPTKLDEVAERIAEQTGEANGALGETVLLKLLRDTWDLNRLGLNAADRDVLQALLDGDTVAPDNPSVVLLAALGLVTTTAKTTRLSPAGLKLGKEAVFA